MKIAKYWLALSVTALGLSGLFTIILIIGRTDDPPYQPRLEPGYTFPRLKKIDLLAYNRNLCPFFSSISSTSSIPHNPKVFRNTREFTKAERTSYPLYWVDRW